MAKHKLSDFFDIAALFLCVTIVLIVFFYAIIKYG
ncbi:hypothetical protein [Klebsiella phage YC1]|nr:hypothetical protein KPN8_57 [Klebsiella phage KPN8]WNY40891.1 hypothetical protein [Klebsiella phage YC1]